MKNKGLLKLLILICCCSLLTSLVGCVNNPDDPEKGKGKTIDIDLSIMNDTMAYSTMVNILNDAENNIGKRLKVSGKYDYQNGCHWLVMTDDTLCCSIGMEFMLDNQEYPSIGTNITLYGIFGQYTVSQIQHYFLMVEEII